MNLALTGSHPPSQDSERNEEGKRNAGGTPIIVNATNTTSQIKRTLSKGSFLFIR